LIKFWDKSKRDKLAFQLASRLEIRQETSSRLIPHFKLADFPDSVHSARLQGTRNNVFDIYYQAELITMLIYYQVV